MEGEKEKEYKEEFNRRAKMKEATTKYKNKNIRMNKNKV